MNRFISALFAFAAWCSLSAAAPEERVTDELLNQAQAALQQYAKSNNIAFGELFNPAGGHRARTVEIVRKAVSDMRGKAEWSVEDVLAGFVQRALEERLGSADPKAFDDIEAPAPKPQKAIMRSTQPGEQLVKVSVPHQVLTDGLHAETLKILESIESGDETPDASGKPAQANPPAAKPTTVQPPGKDRADKKAFEPIASATNNSAAKAESGKPAPKKKGKAPKAEEEEDKPSLFRRLFGNPIP